MQNMNSAYLLRFLVKALEGVEPSDKLNEYAMGVHLETPVDGMSRSNGIITEESGCSPGRIQKYLNHYFGPPSWPVQWLIVDNMVFHHHVQTNTTVPVATFLPVGFPIFQFLGTYAEKGSNQQRNFLSDYLRARTIPQENFTPLELLDWSHTDVTGLTLEEISSKSPFVKD